MPRRKCCINNCKCNIRNCTLYHFPRTKRISERWVEMVKPYYPSISHTPWDKICYVRICKHHFEARFIVNNTRKKLAYPTLFSSTEIRSGCPSQQPNLPCSRIDHFYCLPVNNVSEFTGSEITNNMPELNIPSTFENSGHTENGDVVLRSTSPGPSQREMEASTPNRGRNVLRRSRMIQSVQKLTPRCKKLYRQCIKIAQLNKRIKFSSSQKIKNIENFLNKNSFEAVLSEMPKPTQLLLKMQLMGKKRPHGRRFSTEEKIFSLSILKRSPKTYRFLQKMFVLPSKRTLILFTQELKINSGINHNILAHVKEETKGWSPTKKLCSIVFDEVAISSLTSFNESEDIIEGLVDMGTNKRTKNFCDHALVFMIRGLCSNWKQQIAFYFVEGSVSPLELKSIIKDVVNAVVDIGLTPKTLICDQGPTFQSCFKSMLEDTRREHRGELYEDHAVTINGHRLLMIFDPPHLIKGIRNNLLTKDMAFLGKTARWGDILEVYQADCQLGDIRLLHKLTDEHVIPQKIRKMKVRNCTQVLSERTSAMLNYTSRFAAHADGTPVSSTMKDTAEAVLFFDRLFDSLNGSRRGNAPGKMRGPVSDVDGVSEHVEVQLKALQLLLKTRELSILK